MRNVVLFTVVFITLVGMLISCSDNPAEPPPDDTLAKFTCVDCHTDQAKLMDLATTEPPSTEESGEG